MTQKEAIKVFESAYYDATIDIIDAMKDIVTRNEASREYPEKCLFDVVNALTDVVMSNNARNVRERATRAVDEMKI